MYPAARRSSYQRLAAIRSLAYFIGAHAPEHLA